MTHCEQALDFMQKHGSITPQDALHFRPHGCTRLAARIADLKALGYDIEKVMETKRYDDGVSVSYARYFIREEKTNDGTYS